MSRDSCSVESPWVSAWIVTVEIALCMISLFSRPWAAGKQCQLACSLEGGSGESGTLFDLVEGVCETVFQWSGAVMAERPPWVSLGRRGHHRRRVLIAMGCLPQIR